jgi:lipopolysaccharide transport system permease protein
MHAAEPKTLPRFRDLLLHLAGREVRSKHRWTVLGWTWPLTRQLVQLGVLVFVFGALFDLGIENYAVFLFTGLVAFNWFSSGVADAASSLVTRRHFVFQPRFPSAVLPAVSVAVPFLDVLLALPVLVAMLLATGGLHAGALLLLPLLAIQLVLMCGLGWLVAAATVYLRDVPNVVLVGLTLLFYMTPVFYGLEHVPRDLQRVLQANPLTTLIEAYRAVLLGQSGPEPVAVAIVAAGSVALAATGLAVFRRLEPGFVDTL